MVGDALDGSAGESLGLFGGFLAVGVHPGVVLADVHHVEEERIQPARLDSLPERVLVEQRRTGGDDYAVELEFPDVLLDQFLARVRAHVLVVPREGYTRELFDVLGDVRAIHHGGDIVAAVADIKADPNFTVGLFFHGRPFKGSI